MIISTPWKSAKAPVKTNANFHSLAAVQFQLKISSKTKFQTLTIRPIAIRTSCLNKTKH